MGNSDVVIRVEGLGKKYVLHHEQAERYTSLRDIAASQVKNVGRMLNPFTLAGQFGKLQFQGAIQQVENEDEFWALKNVNLEIRRGERVGVIGCNGAGKSTLLKILSRITEPTTGRVEICGRLASLLEVGTGFHPELTARENIYLNGAILGMSRREISAKFDEIVDFAEVEKFLDTPVKRYSSGMYVRLAFAVAAHLDPEILVVDEVLAVGDARFQQKCLGKMQDVSEGEGKTIILVSHQMNVVADLANTCIQLDSGMVKRVGSSKEVIASYIAEVTSSKSSMKALTNFENELISLSVASVIPNTGLVKYTEAISLSMRINAKSSLCKSARLIATVRNEEGINLFSSALHLTDIPCSNVGVKLTLPSHTFMNGRYTIFLAIGIPGQQRIASDLLISRFQVDESFNGSFYPDPKWPGLVQPKCEWCYE